MKALKLSSIALCVFALVSSCTKDSLETSTASSSSLQSVLGANGKGTAEPQSGGSQQNARKTTATVAYTVAPALASLTDNVTISGTITLAAPADQFVYGVDVTKKDADGNWVAFPVTGMSGNVNLANGQTTSSENFTYSFLASTWGPGEYRIRIHVGGQDVDNMFSDEKTLIIKDCEALNATGRLVTAEPLGNNNYRFTVTYTVKSCPAMGAAKLQGGLTAFSSIVNSYDGSEQKGVERKETNNSNFIYYWLFNITENYSNTFTMVFEKEIKEDGLQNITGAWSVSAKDPSTGSEVRVDIPAVTFTK